MLSFKKIEQSDINELKKYYDYDECMGCDTNLLNAYLWRNEYNIKFAFYDDTIVKAYCNPDESVWGYCMPTGKNIKGALEEVFKDAEERNGNLQIVMLTNGNRVMLETMFPDKFDYVRSPENQDYIYTSRDLATLAGKRFHAKRNHISKFYRTYTDTRFETLSDSNIPDALKVAKLWCAENDTDPEASSEITAIREMCDLKDEYNFKGAVLYVDSKPVAMTLGSEISPKVYDINFEKALREYDGVYAVINNEFAKTLTQYEYINREEDMGLEGLKKSKLSYNPVIILDRWNAIPKKR